MGVSAGWRTRFGQAGEQYAEKVLRENGLQILARRFRRGGGEIDLVARDGNELVFVEVKTRRSGGYGHALEAVSWRKRRRLLRAARAFLRETPHGATGMRFDVVAITSTGAGRLESIWIRDAFRD